MEKVLKSRPYIAVEFLILCILVPAYIIITKNAPFMFSFLWGAALYALAILYFVYRDHLQEIWKWQEVTWAAMKPILIRWVFACIGMTIFIWFYDPERMLGLVMERPLFVPVLLILYPLISALPQELIFCSFFFERYRIFFGDGMKMVAASAIIFAYAHVLYINPVAPTLSLIGGYIFAMTYLKTKSLALVTIEHGLYGNFLFVIGLGWYFFGGSVH
jgi:hypothetical protein